MFGTGWKAGRLAPPASLIVYARSPNVALRDEIKLRRT